MKTAVIYARYSCDNQTEQSIEGQLNVCQDYAKQNDILILDTYVDRAMTGTNDNRPAFQKMLKDSAGREWDYILVYKLDRFSRNKYETAIHKKTLRDNGVKVLSAMENIPDTPEGIILESLLEGMNQYYSAELAQKVKRGMRENRRKGFYQGGGLPYGYKAVDHKIVIDDTKADVVLYIFDQYSKGKFVRDIIADLTAKGVFYKGKPFPRNIVYNILKNEKYSGTYRRGDEIVDKMYPQLIPADLFKRVRAIVEKNRYGKQCLTASGVLLLRQKLRCGYCGKPITGDSSHTRNGTIFRYYKCSGRKLKSGCQKMQVRKEFLEEFVLNAIVKRLNDPDIMSGIVTELLKEQDDSLKSNSTLTMLRNEKAGIDKSLDNLVAALESGIVSKTTNKRLQDLERQQSELERQIQLEQSKQTVTLSGAEIRSFYEQALRLNPQMLLSCLVKEIVLYDDRMEIYYNTPLKEGPDDNRGFLFYSGSGTMLMKIYLKKDFQEVKVGVKMFI